MIEMEEKNSQRYKFLNFNDGNIEHVFVADTRLGTVTDTVGGHITQLSNTIKYDDSWNNRFEFIVFKRNTYDTQIYIHSLDTVTGKVNTFFKYL